MPKLWNETLDAHRHDVREAILNSAARLVLAEGLRAVTMSRIAEDAGIGRATLYKYFPSVEAILFAWHERQINHHFEHLLAIGNRERDPVERLESVLLCYAEILQQHHHSELEALLHRGEHVARARHRLRDYIQELITDCAVSGAARCDVSPDELAIYCLHALAAAGELPSQEAAHRLVALVVVSLRRMEERGKD